MTIPSQEGGTEGEKQAYLGSDFCGHFHNCLHMPPVNNLGSTPVLCPFHGCWPLRQPSGLSPRGPDTWMAESAPKEWASLGNLVIQGLENGVGQAAKQLPGPPPPC